MLDGGGDAMFPSGAGRPPMRVVATTAPAISASAPPAHNIRRHRLAGERPDGDPAASSSALANVATVGKRSAGTLDNALTMTASSAPGTAGRTTRSPGGGSTNWRA